MLDQDRARAGSARERMLAEIALLMEETRSAHLHLEGLWRGVVSLDARLEQSRKEREELVTGQARVESELGWPNRKSATLQPAASVTARD